MKLKVILVLALTLGVGCNPVERLVEQGIAEELPGAIGPAERYVVDVAGLRVSTGEATRVTILGERVQPEGAPVLDHLRLELYGVRYDRDAARLDRADSARATANVLPADLAAFLEAHRNVREATITLRPPDGATLRLRPEVAGLSLPGGVAAEMTGRLVAEEGRAGFEVSEVRAGGINLGAAVARRLSEAINPLVDLTDTPAALRVTGVRAVEGSVRVEATGDPTGLRL
jgi:hypothetical protein